MEILTELETSRVAISSATDSDKKAQLGQFFTSAGIAEFMASLFSEGKNQSCYLLDPGAGIGALSAAFLERWLSCKFDFKSLAIDAFEIDVTLQPTLQKTFNKYKRKIDFIANVKKDDFIYMATDSLSENFFGEQLPLYSHVILNPPYKKIRSNTAYRLALRRVGIETVNLYSAFVALALALTKRHGELVAIIPRSFCNGPYYKPFREFILKRSAIRRIHLFSSRNKAFKDDNVLQENIIILLERDATQKDVVVSTSTDDSFYDLESRRHPFNKIVKPNDSDFFIHIPSNKNSNTIDQYKKIRFTLEKLEIKISTGPVVDFRLKEYLRDEPESGCVPLLYPGHFNSWQTVWPKPEFKKPNAIVKNSKTQKWLYPNGYYCVVRRFSSKEEKRRIVANVIKPDNFKEFDFLGFENHLNVFHENKHGLSKALAFGLAVYLNTTAVDEHFRCFNGHTQVNATDLRKIQYPSRADLIALGEWAIKQPELNQSSIDKQLEKLKYGE